MLRLRSFLPNLSKRTTRTSFKLKSTLSGKAFRLPFSTSSSRISSVLSLRSSPFSVNYYRQQQFQKVLQISKRKCFSTQNTNNASSPQNDEKSSPNTKNTKDPNSIFPSLDSEDFMRYFQNFLDPHGDWANREEALKNINLDMDKVALPFEAWETIKEQTKGPSSQTFLPPNLYKEGFYRRLDPQNRDAKAFFAVINEFLRIQFFLGGKAHNVNQTFPFMHEILQHYFMQHSTPEQIMEEIQKHGSDARIPSFLQEETLEKSIGDQLQQVKEVLQPTQTTAPYSSSSSSSSNPQSKIDISDFSTIPQTVSELSDQPIEEYMASISRMDPDDSKDEHEIISSFIYQTFADSMDLSFDDPKEMEEFPFILRVALSDKYRM